MRFFITSLFTFLILVSCKKEKTPDPVNPGSGSSTDGLSSNATNWHGILAVRQLFMIDTANILQSVPFGYPASAVFSSTPITATQTASYTEVDSVSLNNVRFKYQLYDYQDSSYTTFSAPYHWKVDGRGVIPDINYTNADPFPSYTGYASLPDTAYNDAAFTIDLTNLSNCNSGTVHISDGTGNILYREISITGTSIQVSFTAGEMSSFADNAPNVVIGITLIKNNGRSFGSKAFNFTSECLYSKGLQIR